MNEPKDTNAIKIQALAPLLQVFDMPTSLRFYRDLLGFAIKNSSGEGDEVDWVLLSLADSELMLNAAYEKHERPAAPAPVRTASHTDVTLYFGCPDIDAAYTYLREKGIRLKRPFITKYGWKALDLIDPDGYGLCLHWPEDET